MENYDTDGTFTHMANNANKDQALVDAGKLVVVFEMFPVIDDEASAKEGRPIHKEREFIKIFSPGDRLSVIHREVFDVDRVRFSRQYEAFKNGIELQDPGTPLKMVGFLNDAQRKDLAFFKVTTVENLANMPDHVCQKFMGINGLRQKARDYLQNAKDSAHVTEMRRAIEEKDNQIEALLKQVKEQGERVSALEARIPQQGNGRR